MNSRDTFGQDQRVPYPVLLPTVKVAVFSKQLLSCTDVTATIASGKEQVGNQWDKTTFFNWMLTQHKLEWETEQKTDDGTETQSEQVVEH